jgi:acetylornithine deacetylase/succinyl-diaminopimelate desuccinylase-like protein
MNVRRDGHLDTESLAAFVAATWEDAIVPALVDYIAIPAKSPAFDPAWQANGYIEQALRHVESWCRSRDIPGLSVEVVRLDGRTPLLFMESPATGDGAGDDTVLLYGHYDKQPEMTGWRDGLGPWTPVRDGDRLYGRGGADDGYSAFASLTAIEALHRHGGGHARCVVLIEGCEESGSADLPHYIDALADRIGKPSLVVCLDSGCGNYDQLWGTTSLRGMVSGTLRVDVLTEGVHSGDASGIVPSSFRILRRLLSRIEDEVSGRILIEAAHAPIPEDRVVQARVAAQNLGDMVWRKYPFVDGMSATGSDLAELILARTWRPTLSATGQAGMPDVGSAGNVLRPSTALALSLRLPPTVESRTVLPALQRLLTESPPYGAEVRFDVKSAADGWNAPPLAPWLEAATDAASRAFFGRPAVYMGEGGSIPFMGMLGEKFPDAQFLITGVLGPQSNAHGPNEFLHIPAATRLTACVATILADHAARDRRAGAGATGSARMPQDRPRTGR